MLLPCLMLAQCALAQDSVVWRDTTSGFVQGVAYNDFAVSSETTLAIVPNNDWKIAAIADFNGDGHDDLLWRNQANGQNYMH